MVAASDQRHIGKQEIIAAVAHQTGVDPAAAERVLDAFTGFVAEQAAAGDRVAWPGFGSFIMVERGERFDTDRRTGKVVVRGPSRALRVDTAAVLRERLQQRSSVRLD